MYKMDDCTSLRCLTAWVQPVKTTVHFYNEMEIWFACYNQNYTREVTIASAVPLLTYKTTLLLWHDINKIQYSCRVVAQKYLISFLVKNNFWTRTVMTFTTEFVKSLRGSIFHRCWFLQGKRSYNDTSDGQLTAVWYSVCERDCQILRGIRQPIC